MSVEGETSDGKYNPYGGADFMGYENFGTGTPRVKADNKDSPYKLPYAPGSSVYCVQGNQGLVSHNFLNVQQTYAYDFSLDQDVEILAARPGTVVAWWEDVEDDSMGDPISWNFIAIRHDVDDRRQRARDRPAIRPRPWRRAGADDRDLRARAQEQRHRGAQHQRPDAARADGRLRRGVEHGVPAITVKRGMPIMLAGSTGISFNNHLHMHVIPDPGHRRGRARPDRLHRQRQLDAVRLRATSTASSLRRACRSG